MKKRLFIIDTLTVGICALIIFSMAVGFYVLPHKKLSEEENRILADFPKASMSSVTSGRFFRGLSSFYADRLPLRIQMIRAKAYCELASGKMQNNDVIFLPSGHLIDRCEYESTDKLFENLAKIKAFTDKNQNSVSCVVPRSVDVYTQSPSAQALSTAVYQYMEDDTLLHALRASASEGERTYFKTDHHLDTDGAFILYENIMSSLGIQAHTKSDFSEQAFSSCFLGSIYSKCGLICQSADTVTLLRYAGDTELDVSCQDHGCELNSIYDFSASGIKDKYQVFTSGNHGIFTVSMQSSTPRPKLLLIKDSFANAVIPLLALHFELTVYDPRYTDKPPAAQEFDHIAIIMGLDTLQSL